MTTMNQAFDIACQTLHTIYQNIDTPTKTDSPDMDGDKLDGNGNSGQILNGPTYNSANGGSIVFDGSNEYLDFGNILNNLTNIIFENIQPYLYTILAVLIIMFLMNLFQH